jgi:hypothetical protein
MADQCPKEQNGQQEKQDSHLLWAKYEAALVGVRASFGDSLGVCR